MESHSKGAGPRVKDAGSVSAFVVCLAATFVVVAGLAIDSGRIVAARIEVSDHAENAARIAAQQVRGIRSGERVIDAGRADSEARRYLARFGVRGEVLVDGRTVTVTASMVGTMTLLKILGIADRTVTATRRAQVRDR